MTSSSPAQRLEAVDSGVWRLKNRGFESNTYICEIDGTRQCVVVDPGVDEGAIFEAVRSLDLEPAHVFLTHGHFDHIASVAALQSRHRLTVYLHISDTRTVKSANFTMLLLGRTERITIPTIDVLAEDGSVYSIQSSNVSFMHTPGHTPGSSTILFGNVAFTGDSMFRAGTGITGFPGEDRAQVVASARKLWNELPDSVVVAPGHGDYIDLGHLKETNAKLRHLIQSGDAEDGD